MYPLRQHTSIWHNRVVFAGTVGAIAAGGRFRQWHRHWGTRSDRVYDNLPGDDLIPMPRYQSTRTIEIEATPSAIWPWLLQIGEGRGGFYSFDRLENMAGMTVHSVDRIDPELQGLAVGEIVPLSRYGGPTVTSLIPEREMVLHFNMNPFTGKPITGSAQHSRWFDWSWAFILQPIDSATTRLCIRTRANYAPAALLAPLVAGIVEPAHFIMERQMLKGIKRRVETNRSQTMQSIATEQTGGALHASAVRANGF